MLNYGTQPDTLGPLTAAQRSIWAAQQLRPDVPYNFAAFVAIDHDVDVERLSVACQSAAARFGAPCARLALEDGEPVFVVDRSFPETIRCIDLRAESHEPRVFQGDVRIFAAVGDRPDRGPFLSENWRPYISGNIVMYSVGCTHNEMLTPESVAMYGKRLNRLLVRVERQLELAPIGRFGVTRCDDDELGGERAG